MIYNRDCRTQQSLTFYCACYTGTVTGCYFLPYLSIMLGCILSTHFVQIYDNDEDNDDDNGDRTFP